MKIHYITANVIEQDDFSTSIRPFRGLAFRDPQTGHWCALRTGCSIVAWLGDELRIRSLRPVRASWQHGLSFRLPARVKLSQLPFIIERGTATSTL